MTRISKIILSCAFLVRFAASPLHAQDTQFLPEVDAHLTLNSMLRTYLQAKDDREGGDPTQFAIGPSLQFYLKPLLKLKKVKSFDLDDSKKRFLVWEAGYRYITAPGASPENRMLVATTLNFPVGAGSFLPTATAPIWTGRKASLPGATATNSL